MGHKSGPWCVHDAKVLKMEILWLQSIHLMSVS